MALLTPPKYITEILSKLNSKGFSAYIVGGSVRDAAMNRPTYDWDVSTSATPTDVVKLFDKTILTGEKFGTITVVIDEHMVEVTTFRIEGNYLDARHPESVTFVTDIKEDLSRRDFTINAMAMSPAGELVDPYGGMDDIKEGVIRCVGEPSMRFSEDALRMLRAFRFSAQLGFKIEKNTLSAIKLGADNINNVSAERIHMEIEKIVMSKRPESVGEVIKAGLLNRFLTGSHKNSIELCRLNRLPDEVVLRWGGFCAALLDEKCIESAWTFLRELHVENKIVKTVHTAMLINKFPADHIGQKRLMAKYGTGAVRLAAVINDIRTGESLKSLIAVHHAIASGECFSLERLAVTGSDLIKLGFKEGPELGKTLHKLLDYVIVNPTSNKRDELLELVKKDFK